MLNDVPFCAETKDLKELIQKMLKDRKSDPPKKGEETLLDLIINYSDDEEQQLAECLEFTTAGLHGMEFCKYSRNSLTSTLMARLL